MDDVNTPMVAFLLVTTVLAGCSGPGGTEACTEETPVLSGQDLSLESWSMPETNVLELTIRARLEGVTVTGADVSAGGTSYTASLDQQIDAGGTATVSIDLTEEAPFSSGACVSPSVSLDYRVDGPLEGSEMSTGPAEGFIQIP